jgi:hypothetical protein
VNRQIGRRDMTPFTKPFALLLGVAQWFSLKYI